MIKRSLVKLPPFAIILILITAVFSPFFHFEYATDTYTIKTVGMQLFGDSMFQNGRIISAEFFYGFAKMNASVEAFYYTSFVLSLLFSALAVWAMYQILRSQFSKNKSLLFAFFTVFNPLVIEYFLFIEKGFFMFALAMSMLAAYFYLLFLKGKRLALILAYPCIILSSFTYQTLPGAFVPVAVLLITLYSKQIKDWIINTLVAVSVYGGGTLGNFLFLRIFSSSVRVASKPDIGNFFYALSLLGTGALILIGIAIMAILLALSYWRSDKTPACIRSTFLKSLFILCGTVAVTFFPFIFIARNEIWLPFRIGYPLGMLFGLYPIFFSAVFPKEKKSVPQQSQSRQANKALILACTLSLILCLFFEIMVLGRLQNNAADESLCMKIGEAITQYEKTSGNEVLYVSISHDARITKTNPWVLSIGDSNVRAFSKEWSDVAHLNVLLNKSYQKVAVSAEVYQTYFAEKNWNTFSAREQLIFEENTLHICVY